MTKQFTLYKWEETVEFKFGGNLKTIKSLNECSGALDFLSNLGIVVELVTPKGDGVYFEVGKITTSLVCERNFNSIPEFRDALEQAAKSDLNNDISKDVQELCKFVLERVCAKVSMGATYSKEYDSLYDFYMNTSYGITYPNGYSGVFVVVNPETAGKLTGIVRKHVNYRNTVWFVSYGILEYEKGSMFGYNHAITCSFVNSKIGGMTRMFKSSTNTIPDLDIKIREILDEMYDKHVWTQDRFDKWDGTFSDTDSKN